jgi:hypothetical protein
LSKGEESASALADMDYTLGRITTFATSSRAPAPELRKGLESPKEAAAVIASLRERYENRLREFDTEFLGHFGGMMHVCEGLHVPMGKTRVQFEGIRQLAIDRYWMPTPQERLQTINRVDTVGASTIRQLQGTSAERCTRMIALGRNLMGVYWRRLKPYARDDWSNVTFGDRLGESILFTMNIAIELEAFARPASSRGDRCAGEPHEDADASIGYFAVSSR